MRRLPTQVDRDIWKRLLQGVAYRRIGHEFDVSIATVSRVFDDAKKEMPDVVSLRELSVLLRKAGLSVFDAKRACNLMESLNKWSIGVEELGDYVRVNEEFLSERALNEDFLFYATKLMQLEQVYGRTYQEVVEDFAHARNGATEAEARKAALEKESLGLAAELKDSKKDLAEIKLKIEKATTVHEGLAEIGLDRLAQFVRFIQDCESLGFDADQVKRLAVWRQELQKLQINPDGLGKFVEEKGRLEAQNHDLRRANERIEADVNTQATWRATLLAGNSALQAVDRMLRTGTLTLFCKSCGYPLPTVLPTQESLRHMIGTGQVLCLGCPRCGVQHLFSPWEIALQAAWTFLPTKISPI